ncbi:hypothetical protein JMUB7542_27750 [Staphylococcus aureus]
MSNYQQKNNAVNTVVNVNQLSILDQLVILLKDCLLYTSPSPRD